jgi:hypothetical protein
MQRGLHASILHRNRRTREYLIQLRATFGGEPISFDLLAGDAPPACVPV